MTELALNFFNFDADIAVAIVTMSPQTELIQGVLDIAFPELTVAYNHHCRFNQN